MPLVRIPIPVSNPEQIMEDFKLIEVHRAETKWGTYSEITTAGGLTQRIRLDCDQFAYEFDDKTGSEYLWYKWRYRNDVGPTFSSFFEPVQGYTPNATYCGFDIVRRILGNGEYSKKIRFSDYYKNIRPGRSNDATSTIALAAITTDPGYSGHERFLITFTSVTEFEITVYESQNTTTRLVGTGDVATDFVSADKSIYIDSADWSGVAVADDTIEFETESHMSINDAVRFINDAEVLVDSLLEQSIAFLEAKDTELRFTRDTVPKAIRLATARFAAFFIYTTIFSEQNISGLPNNINDITAGLKRDDDLSSWAIQAKKYLGAYIHKYQKFFDPETGTANTTGPRWRGLEPLFDGAGVYGVGKGLKLPEEDFHTETTSMNYAGLLDYDLLSYYWSEGYEYTNG